MDVKSRVSGGIPQAIANPSKWLNSYGDFITKNSSAVAQIESGLRSLTYVIPGRFRESELASESLYSGVNLLGMYHDTLLARAVSKLPSFQRPHQTPHTRYTKYWSKTSTTYRRLATLLQMIQYTELLWEMAARRRGESIRWRVVIFLELIKALTRLCLLRLTNSRPLLSPPLPERVVDPSKLEESTPNANKSPDTILEGTESPASETFSTSSTTTSTSDDTKWTMPRTGLTLPSLPDASDISAYLLGKVLTADDIKPPKALLHRVSGKGSVAEILYILRPVIYAIAMQQCCVGRGAEGKRDWRPWMLGFGIEYAARQLAKRDLSERVVGGLRGLTGLEREEMRKRGWGMGWWVMRGAFYENFTRSWIQGFGNAFRGKMLLDLVATVVDDYDFLWDQYYFPTATL